MERITATYYIETPYAPEKAAAVLAGEQSSGTFVAVPGATSKDGKYHRAVVKVSWSMENFGTNLPVMVSTLQGNLYEITQFTGLKLIDIELPPLFGNQFHGPAFGIEGCRTLTGVQGRPMIGTIIKPSIGLTPEQTATMVKTLAEAGIDFVKDDELLSSSANSSFNDRVDAVMNVINAHADKTGKKVMYAFNLSGEVDEMLQRYEKIVSSGGTCAMISINSVGLAAAKKIMDQRQLAIHAHRNGWGMLTRHPLLGIDYKAYQKIWRL
jgi:ribulose-bisphosphate carboxylase large chain